MKIKQLKIPDVLLLQHRIYGDHRGYLMECFNAKEWEMAGAPRLDFIQDNLSCSASIGTVRGLHYQIGKNAQAKLFQCVQGKILDVALDLRFSSPTFGQYVTQELEGGSGQQLLIPAGFAHGFATLRPDTIVHYKITAPYDPNAERGIYWADPHLSIKWGVTQHEAVISDRDKKWPLFAGADYFHKGDHDYK